MINSAQKYAEPSRSPNYMEICFQLMVLKVIYTS